MVKKKGEFKKTSFHLLGAIVTLVFCLIYYFKPTPIYTVDLKIYDLFFLLKGRETPPENIVIIAIDEPSLEKLGRWPWSRRVISTVVEKLTEYSPAVIAFDIILSEPEKNDPLLTKTISKAGNVLMPVVFFFDKEDPIPNKIILNSAIKIINPERLIQYFPISSKSVLIPTQTIARASAGFGHINIFPDPDGTVRSEALYIEYNGYFIPSLALKTAAVYLGIPSERLLVNATESIYVGKKNIPTDKYGRILIPYYGGNQTFKYISVVDVLEGRIKKEELEEKILLIGATAVGIYDLRVTPVSSALPGVEKHANVIASIISGKSLKNISTEIAIFFIILIGVLSTTVYTRLKVDYSFIALIGFLFMISLLSYLLFVFKGVWFSPLYSFGNLIVQFILIIVLRHLYTEKEAKHIKKIFSNYVTERVVNELIKDPSMAKLGGERRDVTVLFSDIRGFTALSEKIQPENVIELLNEYFAAMTEVIFKWEGTLDKFIGDAIMVFWGAPLPQPDHAERAVRCAIEMSQKLKELCKKWSYENKPTINIGIGINTGEVLVGNIGVEGKKMDYTVIGDHVNLASRLEGLNKEFNSEIIISEFTFQRIDNLIKKGVFNSVIFKELGEIRVKGREKTVRIYAVITS